MNAKRFKLLRVAAGLSQLELANMLGLAQSAISAWENGTAHPAATKLPTLAKALNCTIDELYGEG